MAGWEGGNEMSGEGGRVDRDVLRIRYWQDWQKIGKQ